MLFPSKFFVYTQTQKLCVVDLFNYLLVNLESVLWEIFSFLALKIEYWVSFTFIESLLAPSQFRANLAKLTLYLHTLQGFFDYGINLCHLQTD